MVKGIDCSHWQPLLDYDAAFADGIKFMSTKVSDGINGLDPTRFDHINAARAAGLLVGAFHFYRPGMDGTAQAENFIKNCPPNLDWYCFDFEDHGSISVDQQLKEAKDFLDAIYASDQISKDPWIYLSSNFADELGNPSWLANYRLWLANYNPKSSRHFYVPKPWDKYTIWQNAEDGQCAGLQDGHSVDTDVFDGSLDELKALFSK